MNMNNIENTERGIGWFERVLNLVEKYKIRHFFKAAFVILLIAGVVGFLKNPTWIFEQYEMWKEKQHQETIDLRLQNTHKIQHLMEKSLYKIECDRIILLELHNGNTGIGGLPFAKCTATYEVMDDNILPIAQQYQEQNLSLIPFANKLFKEGYWCGNVKDLEEFDRGLYHKMASNGTNHFAACVIEGVDKPLAFLFVSFNEQLTEEHNCQIVREQIRHISLELALLLEINKNYK